jgi:hypothetical protein
VIVDNSVSPPFPVFETSAQLLYLLKLDKEHKFSFTDELEQSELVQWLFFWHGSGAPYQGNLGFFRRAAEKLPCESHFLPSYFSLYSPNILSLLKLPLSASVKKPRASSASWKSDFRASILASHVITWLGKARGSIQLLILGRGLGSRTTLAVAILKRK